MVGASHCACWRSLNKSHGSLTHWHTSPKCNSINGVIHGTRQTVQAEDRFCLQIPTSGARTWDMQASMHFANTCLFTDTNKWCMQVRNANFYALCKYRSWSDVSLHLQSHLRFAIWVVQFLTGHLKIDPLIQSSVGVAFKHGINYCPCP